jgi:hypothetical protein
LEHAGVYIANTRHFYIRTAQQQLQMVLAAQAGAY